MNKKIFTSILLILVLILGVSLSSVSAKNDKKVGDSSNSSGQGIPEEDGTYDVIGHPELKVRVIIHKAKPSIVPQPTLQCGLQDPNSSSTVAAAGWHLPSTYTYNLNLNNVPALVGAGNWPIITEKSFNTWNSVLAGKANVIRGSNTTISKARLDGKNIVAWGAASASALGVTYIWYYPSTGQVAELDTIMNKIFTWEWSNSIECAYAGVYDAQNILTHEIGHWFGLNDHYTGEYANNTMYGYGSKTEVKKNTLTAGDIAGLDIIY